MKRDIWLLIAVAIIFSGVGIVAGLKKADAPVAANHAATSAHPHFFAQSLVNLDNQTENLSKWHGNLLLVNFWATWCAPCVEEMPELSALQADAAYKNLQIIGIGIDSPDNIQTFAKKYNISYPLYIAGMGGSELSKQLGNHQGGLPFTVLIGVDGQIKKTYLGRLDMATVRQDVAAFF